MALLNRGYERILDFARHIATSGHKPVSIHPYNCQIQTKTDVWGRQLFDNHEGWQKERN